MLLVRKPFDGGLMLEGGSSLAVLELRPCRSRLSLNCLMKNHLIGKYPEIYWSILITAIKTPDRVDTPGRFHMHSHNVALNII